MAAGSDQMQTAELSNGIVIDLIADTSFLDACREREDRYNERD
jgi:hypothetical protein